MHVVAGKPCALVDEWPEQAPGRVAAEYRHGHVARDCEPLVQRELSRSCGRDRATTRRSWRRRAIELFRACSVSSASARRAGFFPPALSPGSSPNPGVRCWLQPSKSKQQLRDHER